MDGEWERTVRSMASDPTRPLTILDRGSVNDLFAEIDRLRALPVLATCGECGHAPSRYARPRVCQHPALFDREDPVLLAVERADAPPTDCPLRGAR